MNKKNTIKILALSLTATALLVGCDTSDFNSANYDKRLSNVGQYNTPVEVKHKKIDEKKFIAGSETVAELNAMGAAENEALKKEALRKQNIDKEVSGTVKFVPGSETVAELNAMGAVENAKLKEQAKKRKALEIQSAESEALAKKFVNKDVVSKMSPTDAEKLKVAQDENKRLENLRIKKEKVMQAKNKEIAASKTKTSVKDNFVPGSETIDELNAMGAKDAAIIKTHNSQAEKVKKM